MRGKSALLNIFWTIIELVIVTISGFIVPNYIIHTYGSSVNGLISSISQFLGYISLVESGIGAIGRASLYKPLSEKDTVGLSKNVGALERFYHKVSYIFVGYVAILLFLFPLLINGEFDWVYTATLIVILAFSTFIQYFFGITSQTVIQADQKKYVSSILQSVTLLLNMIITIVLIKSGASIHVVKIGSAMAYAIRPVFLYLYAKKHYEIDKNVEPSSTILRQRWDGLAQHIAFFVHKNTDIVVLTVLASLKEVSVYSVYMLAVAGCSKMVYVFTNNLEPAFGNMIAKGEREVLKSRVRLCSMLTNQITVVLFSTAIIVISPFVELYTRGILDANYIRPAFGVIILVAEALYCIRMPYQAVVYAYGHFKQTRNGAIAEAVLNIFLSVILVFAYGLIGVAIGTLISMGFRTCQYIWYYHTRINNERDGLLSEIKSLFIYAVEIVFIIIAAYSMPTIMVNGYAEWFAFSCLVGVMCSLIVLVVSLVFFKKEMLKLYMMIKRIIAHK